MLKRLKVDPLKLKKIYRVTKMNNHKLLVNIQI